MGKLVAAVGGFGVLYLTVAACGGLFDQQTPPSGQQQSDHTTVISTGSDNSAFWIVIVLLVVGGFALVRYATRQEARADISDIKADVAQLEKRLLATQQGQVPALEQRPVLNGHPVDYPEYRQIGR
jgi:H+/Cl- antiporter ClcA